GAGRPLRARCWFVAAITAAAPLLDAVVTPPEDVLPPPPGLPGVGSVMPAQALITTASSTLFRGRVRMRPAACRSCTEAREGATTFLLLPHYVSRMSAAKEIVLIDWIRERQRVAIGFSGGVDSSYLAAVAVESVGAANTLAIIGRSESLAGSEEDH